MNRRPETISPLFFISLPPSNLRPFGAPPSIGRRECPHEPLPLEGAAERSEAGLASFLGRRSRLLFAFPIEEGFAKGNGILVSSSIPRKNDHLLRAVVFMCITCLRKRRLNHRIRFNQRFPRTPLPSSSPYRRQSKGSGRGSGRTPRKELLRSSLRRGFPSGSRESD